MIRRLTAISGAAAMAAALAGCGLIADGGSSAADERYLPTGSPDASVTMTSPPDGYATVSGEGFEISAPEDFEHQQRTSSNGEPMLVLEKPSSEEGVPQRVAVVRDVDPEQSAAEQSYTLETAKSAAGPDGAERSEVEVPDGSAFLITWQEMLAVQGGAPVQVTYWQLMDQVSDDLILNVVAFAPTTEFDSSEVSTILRTLVVDDDASA